MIKKTSAKSRMIKVLLASVGFAAMSGQAADGFYVRADVSNVSGSMIEEDFVGALATNHDFVVNRYDITRTGYQVSLGFQWDQHASTEIGYLDLGEVDVNLALSGEANLDAFSWDFSQQYPISAEGFTLVQGLTLNPADTLKVIGEVGLYVWRSKVDVEQDPITLKKNNGEDPIVGLRLELPIAEHVGLGMGIRRVYFDTQEVDLMSVTGVFRF